MTTRYVTPAGGGDGTSTGSPLTLAAALAAHVYGDIISIVPGSHFVGLTTISSKAGLTITCPKGADTELGLGFYHPARFVRQALFDQLLVKTSILDFKIENITVMIDPAIYPVYNTLGPPTTSFPNGSSTVTWATVGRDSSSTASIQFSITGTNVWVDGCEVVGKSTGVDVTQDTTGCFNGEYLNMPKSLYFLGCNGAKVTKTYIHDAVCGVKWTMSGTTFGYEEDQCWFENIYQDANTMSQISNAEVPYIRVTRNVFWNFFGKSADYGNPHCDIMQHFSTFTLVNGLPPKVRQRGFAFERNILGMQSNCRAPVQRSLLQGKGGTGVAGSSLIYVGPRFVKNLLVSLPTEKGVQISSAEDPYVRQNICVTMHGQATGLNANMRLAPPSGNPKAQAGNAGIARNISENYSGVGEGYLVPEGNLQISPTVNGTGVGGVGSTKVAFSTVFDNYTNTISNLADLWAAWTVKPAYSGYAVASTLQSLLLDPLSRADETYKYGAVTTVTGTPPDSVSSSYATILRGGDDGTPVPITVSAGLEWRELDSDKTTQTQPWSSASSGTLHVGKAWELRHHTLKGSGAATTREYTLNGVAYSFTTINSLNVYFPRSQIDGRNDYMKATTRIDWGVGSTSAFTFVMRGLINTSDQAAYLFNRGQGSGNYVQVRNSGAGSPLALNITAGSGVNKLQHTTEALLPVATNVYPCSGRTGPPQSQGHGVTRELLTSADGLYTCTSYDYNDQTNMLTVTKANAKAPPGTVFTGLLANNNPPNTYTTSGELVITGTIRTIFWSVDLSQQLSIVYFDDNFGGGSPNFDHLTEGSLATWNMASAAAVDVLFGTIASPPGSRLFADVEFIWAAPVFMDISDPSVQTRFSAAYIGDDGDGPTGVAPPLFIPFGAPAVNAGNGNRGSGGSVLVTGSLDSVANNQWPPKLEIEAEVQDPGPYQIGQPIKVLYRPLGNPKGFTLEPIASLAGTWDETTQLVPKGTNGVQLTFTPSVAGECVFSSTNSFGHYDPSTSPILGRSNLAPSVMVVLASNTPTVSTQAMVGGVVVAKGSILLSYSLDQRALVSTTVTPRCDLAGTFTPPTCVIAVGQSSGTVSFKPDVDGDATFSATVDQAIAAPDPMVIHIPANIRGQLVRMGIR